MEKFTKANIRLCSFCANSFVKRPLLLNCSSSILTTASNTERSFSYGDGNTNCTPFRLKTTLTDATSTRTRCLSYASLQSYQFNRGIGNVISKQGQENDKDLRCKTHNFQQLPCAVKYSTDSSQSPLPSRKSNRNASKSPISWKLLLIVVGIGGGVLLWMQYLKKKKELRIEAGRQKYIGKAHLGGDWTLVDHHGNTRSSKDFRGQWLLIYFGFTHCPDICPEEIEKIVNVINKTDAEKNIPKIQPIVITVDPERDTPAALKEYCGEFSPRLLGFTGTQDDILRATRAYRVYYSAGPKDDDSDYIVDHSIISYLVNPKGEFVDFFGQDKTVDQMFNLILFHIRKYMKSEGKP
ncbi:unnamed protein product [Lymnaea stagnalis]|uniref:Uncharacterized protein n=1 Tax=Lymnaea stagnalis TaxID=6523 RepID=A0AAV2H9F6_LYMST